MDLRQLRYFVAVAEERHFGRAAQRLRMAQPPLSRQIQRLEAELGFHLFDRSRRHVELTPAANVLLEHAANVFAAVDLAIRESARASVGQSGRLLVGYLSSLAYSGLTDLLRAYRTKSPGVDIVLRELSPAEQIDAIKQERLDVGFIRGPLDDATLRTECVRKEPLVAAFPTDHPLAKRKRIALKALANEPFVLFPRNRSPAYFDYLMSLCRKERFTPRIVQEAPQLDMISLVAAGFGVSIVPSSVQKLNRKGLVLLPIVGHPRADLLLAWRDANSSPPLREFLDLVRRTGVDTPERAT